MSMEEFMKYNFDITSITANFLPGCTQNSSHRQRNNYGLIYYPEGGYTFHILNGPTLRTSKSSILFLPKGISYDIEAVEKQDCYAVAFNLASNPCLEPFVMNVRRSQFFLDTFKEAEKVARLSPSGGIMSCKAKLCSIISTMQQEYGLGYLSGDNYSLILPAIEKIHQSYFKNTPSVSELALLCNVTPEYFRMLFKKKYGTSPVKYINSLRLAHAKDLLSSGLYSVTEVSTLSGFSALPYFCREFKKKYGISPSVLTSSIDEEE